MRKGQGVVGTTVVRNVIGVSYRTSASCLSILKEQAAHHRPLMEGILGKPDWETLNWMPADMRARTERRRPIACENEISRRRHLTWSRSSTTFVCSASNIKGDSRTVYMVNGIHDQLGAYYFNFPPSFLLAFPSPPSSCLIWPLIWPHHSPCVMS